MAPSRPRAHSAPSVRPIHPDGTRSRGSERDCRCRCGGLVARIVDEGVELRCRRCKRTLLVPWSAREGWAPAREVDADVSGAAAVEGAA